MLSTTLAVAVCQVHLANGQRSYQSFRNMRSDEERFFCFHPAEVSMSTSKYPWRADTSSSNRVPVSGMRTSNNMEAGSIRVASNCLEKASHLMAPVGTQKLRPGAAKPDRQLLAWMMTCGLNAINWYCSEDATSIGETGE